MGVTLNLFYAKSSGKILMVPREDVLVSAYFLLATNAPTLLPLKLESDESMISYST